MTHRKNWPIPVFFLLAFLISWTIWGFSVAKAHGLIAFEIPNAGTFGLLGASIAAWLVACLGGGKAGARDLWRRMTRVRFGFRWYLIPLILPFVVGLAAIGVHMLLGGTSPIGIALPLAIAPLYFLSQIVVHFLSEETGWRGFALPRLQERFSPLVSSVILGLLWATWHLPLWLLPGTPQTAMNFGGFVLSVVATTVIMTWVVNSTGGSGFVAVLYHAAMNTQYAALGTLTNGSQLFWITTGLLTVAALVVVAVGGPQLGRKPAAVAQAAR